jgi:ubiquinone/menaquinone biosynthesis C-methylase UbiE
VTFKPDNVQNLIRRLLFQYWYFGQPPWDTGISPPELIEFIQQHEPGRAIDMGCGTGTNIVTLAQAGWQVTGVDFAPRAVKLATQKLRRAGVSAEVFVRDATRLRGITGPFDLALDIGCFHAFSSENQEAYLDELDRVLAPGGFWLLYGFLKQVPSSPGSGLAEAHLDRITARMNLLSRRDGHDDKRNRSSAWLLFQKK